MGSFVRVNVIYRELHAFLGQSLIPVYGTSLEGDSLYNMSWPQQVIIVFGNESKGISKSLMEYFSGMVSIPKFGQAESLNVGIATAIILNNFKRSENVK